MYIAPLYTALAAMMAASYLASDAASIGGVEMRAIQGRKRLYAHRSRPIETHTWPDNMLRRNDHRYKVWKGGKDCATKPSLNDRRGRRRRKLANGSLVISRKGKMHRSSRVMRVNVN